MLRGGTRDEALHTYVSQHRWYDSKGAAAVAGRDGPRTGTQVLAGGTTGLYECDGPRLRARQGCHACALPVLPDCLCAGFLGVMPWPRPGLGSSGLVWFGFLQGTPSGQGVVPHPPPREGNKTALPKPKGTLLPRPSHGQGITP